MKVQETCKGASKKSPKEILASLAPGDVFSVGYSTNSLRCFYMVQSGEQAVFLGGEDPICKSSEGTAYPLRCFAYVASLKAHPNATLIYGEGI